MARCGWSVGAVVLATLLASSGAQAAPRGVLVLPLEHQNLPTGTATALNQAIRDEVKASLPRYRLLPPPALDLMEMQLAAGCVDASPTCLASIGRTLSAARVVRVVTRGTAERLQLKVMVVRTRNPKASTYDAELLGVDEESVPEFRWHVAKGLGSNPGALLGGMELYTASKVGALAGAELFLDDTKVEPAALANLTPGKHRLEVHQQGFETFIWLGQVRPGRTTRVGVVFEPKRVASAPPAEVSPPPPAEVTPPIESTPPVVSVPPPPPALPPPPPPPLPPPGQTEAPKLVFTWVFAAGTVLAASTATIFMVRTYQADQEVNKEPHMIACREETDADWNSDVCRRGRSSLLIQWIAWGATAAFGGATIAAFFLEDGPEFFSKTGGEDEPTVRWGVAPGPDGVSANLRVDF